MAVDRGERALEDISKTLHSIDRSLKDIAQSARRQSGRIAFRNYQEGENPDGATASAGSTESTSGDYVGQYGSGPEPVV